jgi:hypothetical protein
VAAERDREADQLISGLTNEAAGLLFVTGYSS